MFEQLGDRMIELDKYSTIVLFNSEWKDPGSSMEKTFYCIIGQWIIHFYSLNQHAHLEVKKY